MKKVSIAIPSIYPDKLKQLLESIERHTSDIDYEILVVGPETIKPVVSGRKEVKFMLELEREGPVVAVQRALDASDGEYFVFLNDDVLATENWLSNMLHFLEENDDGRPLCGSFRMKLPSGEELPQDYIRNKFLYAMFGCVKADTIRKLGGWNRGYRFYYIDPDFGLRIWKSGGRVLMCPDSWVIHAIVWDENRKKRWNEIGTEDRKLYYKHWKYWLKLQEFQDWRYWVRFKIVWDIINKIKRWVS